VTQLSDANLCTMDSDRACFTDRRRIDINEFVGRFNLSFARLASASSTVVRRT